MATATIIVVPNIYTCRGLTWLPSSQQCALPVPPGEYDVLPEQDLEYADRGMLKTGRAVPIVNIANGDKWYVGVAVADFLLNEHKRA
jgi:hypothetical protein